MTESLFPRVLSVKIDIDWKKQEDKILYNRLRELSWQAARYRNNFVRRKWAESMGMVPAGTADPHGATKQGRANEKEELSGAAYSAAEREVQAQWSRLGGRILSGSPLPEWRPSAALAIRGHKRESGSGVYLRFEGERYVLYLSAQSKACDGGCWLRLPLAKNEKRDEWQGPILDGMARWEIPILRAAVIVKRSKILVRLSYARKVFLPPMGARVAVLGPLIRGKLFLRTETQTKDYSDKMSTLLSRKDSWDLIRRRVTAQIAWRKGHARKKRILLSRLSWDDWLTSFLHSWTREMVNWMSSQGVGQLRILNIETLDWPAFRFVQMLNYKAGEIGIEVTRDGNEISVAEERAAKSEIGHRQRRTKKRRDAIRELTHQLAAGA